MSMFPGAHPAQPFPAFNRPWTYHISQWADIVRERPDVAATLDLVTGARRVSEERNFSFPRLGQTLANNQDRHLLLINAIKTAAKGNKISNVQARTAISVLERMVA